MATNQTLREQLLAAQQKGALNVRNVPVVRGKQATVVIKPSVTINLHKERICSAGDKYISKFFNTVKFSEEGTINNAFFVDKVKTDLNIVLKTPNKLELTKREALCHLLKGLGFDVDFKQYKASCQLSVVGELLVSRRNKGELEYTQYTKE